MPSASRPHRQPAHGEAGSGDQPEWTGRHDHHPNSAEDCDHRAGLRDARFRLIDLDAPGKTTNAPQHRPGHQKLERRRPITSIADRVDHTGTEHVAMHVRELHRPHGDVYEPEELKPRPR